MPEGGSAGQSIIIRADSPFRVVNLSQRATVLAGSLCVRWRSRLRPSLLRRNLNNAKSSAPEVSGRAPVRQAVDGKHHRR